MTTAPPAPAGPATPPAPPASRRPGTKQLVWTTVLWLVVALVSLAVVVYAVGPLLQARAQRAAVADLRTQVDKSVGAATNSLFGVAAPTKPSAKGDPVAILEIGTIGVQAAVIEGADSGTTQRGPGHVPGTAGLGQPGNSVVVARRNGFGAEFARLDQVAVGDQVVVTTVQGQSLYKVDSVVSGPLDADTAFGRTKDNRLTLTSSATDDLLNTSDAVVATAIEVTPPFVPSPQGGRSDAERGTSGDSSQWPLLVIVLAGFAASAVAATVLYRRWTPLASFAVTAPALISLAVFLAVVAARLLPAWA
ncbi:class E sortase [Rhodococcus aerolatus]